MAISHLRRTAAVPRANHPAPSNRAAAVRVIRRRFALVQLATTVLAGLAGAVVASILVPDPVNNVARVVSLAPALWLAIGAVVFALGSVLTLSLATRFIRQTEEAIESWRQAEHGDGVASVAGLSGADPTILTDQLTGLGNHRAFHEQLDRYLKVVMATDDPLSIALIDLDDFKSFNDGGGYVRGDEVLTEMARILRKLLRRTDLAFRTGGDEFAILMPATRAEDAARTVQRLLATCTEPRAGSPAVRGISFSAGVSDAPARATQRNELVGQAGQALLEAKRAGRTSVQVFDPGVRRELDEPAMRRASASIIDVVRGSSLKAAYQPIVDVLTGRVVGFEGLVRPTPGSGFSDPGSLFAVAEATGRTAELDRLCLQTLLAGAGAMAPDQTLSLNLSPQTVEAPEFSVAQLVRMLAAANFEPGRVVLEVTERQEIADIEVLRKHLAACQSAGFRIGIDDVGSGNAGLRLLSQIHFDAVKIDLSLVQAGTRRESSLEVLRSLSDLAARWGAKAVAEGVETAAHLRMVRDLGLGEAQGYLLGKPGPSPDLRMIDLVPLYQAPDLRATLGYAPSQVSPFG